MQNFDDFMMLLLDEGLFPPTALEEYLRQMQDKGIRASDELIGAAGRCSDDRVLYLVRSWLVFKKI